MWLLSDGKLCNYFSISQNEFEIAVSGQENETLTVQLDQAFAGKYIIDTLGHYFLKEKVT